MKSKTLTIRPTVATDLQQLNIETFGVSMRGRTIELDGKPLGVGGVLHQEMPQAFSTMSDELRKYPKTIVKFITSFETMLKKHYTTVYAVASSKEKNAAACLTRAGFEYMNTDSNGQEVYRWQIQ